MKLPFIYVFCLFVLLSCNTKDKLTFEPISFEKETCDTCATISIKVPKAQGSTKMALLVNSSIREEIISFLNFDEQTEATDIESAITSFIIDYEKLKEKYAEESTPWEATITGEVTYEDNIMLTIRLDVFLFTGGAHGYQTIRFINFSKPFQKEIENEELFVDVADFKDFAETKFREQEHIPMDAHINSTGFMFETDDFYLPNNIGYTKEGLQLFYEQYEIASYADGPITLTLPYHQIEAFLVSIKKP